MSPKNTKKAQTATHYNAVGLGSLSAALSASAIALSLTGPEIIVDAPFGAVGTFCGAGSAGLTSLSKKLGLKVTDYEKNFLIIGHCQTISLIPLSPKSLNDNVVTGREFQIINAELEKIFLT